MIRVQGHFSSLLLDFRYTIKAANQSSYKLLGQDSALSRVTKNRDIQSSSNRFSVQDDKYSLIWNYEACEAEDLEIESQEEGKVEV